MRACYDKIGRSYVRLGCFLGIDGIDEAQANVFYELGIRHALRKKGTVLIKGAPVADATPFDILTDRYLEYSVDEPGKKVDELVGVIRATLTSARETDSPIFKMLPTLPELDPAAVQVVPTDFTDEVARARAAKAAGWLRLLASEVNGQRFQWPALRSRERPPGRGDGFRLALVTPPPKKRSHRDAGGGGLIENERGPLQN